MEPQHPSSPSGSRWEPTPEAQGSPAAGSSPADRPAGPRRWRRGLVIGALTALLAVGGGAAFAAGHALTDDGPGFGTVHGGGGPGGPHGRGPDGVGPRPALPDPGAT